jgi:FtsH-binding integral membrane protein
MNEFLNITQADAAATTQRFFVKVYTWMTIALVLTGLTALYVASSPALINAIFSNNILFFGLVIGELLLVGSLVGWINRMSSQTAMAIFVGYSVLNGLTLSMIFIIYTAGSIASTFFVTAGTFGLMSLYGYLTKSDLTKIGNILVMALIGIVLASLVNMFLKSEMLYWIVTYVGVLIFVGLIAYDTQKIKKMSAYTIDGTEEQQKGAIVGALTLYLDFINLFLLLLRILGRRN